MSAEASVTLYKKNLKWLSNEQLVEVKQQAKYTSATKRRADAVLRERGVYG